MTETATPPAPPAPPPRQSASQRFLLPALVRARMNFQPLRRDQAALAPDERGARGFRYASLHEHLAAVELALLAEDLLLEQDVVVRGGQFFVVTRLIHALSEEWRCGFMPILTPSRPNAQEMGAATTYARRYGIATLLGLAAPDEPDEPHAVRHIEREWPEDAPPPSIEGPEPPPEEDCLAAPEPVPSPAAAPAPAPQPERPPSLTSVIKPLLDACGASDAPAGVWLSHATFIADLTAPVRETLVDRYRRLTGEEPPAIEGVEYPPPLAPRDA